MAVIQAPRNSAEEAKALKGAVTNAVTLFRVVMSANTGAALKAGLAESDSVAEPVMSSSSNK